MIWWGAINRNICRKYFRFSPSPPMKLRFFCLEAIPQTMIWTIKTLVLHFRWIQWAGTFWNTFKVTLIHQVRKRPPTGWMRLSLQWIISDHKRKYGFQFPYHLCFVIFLIFNVDSTNVRRKFSSLQRSRQMLVLNMWMQ